MWGPLAEKHVGKLTATMVRALKEPGSFVDGDGLMLVVNSSGAKSWILRVKEPGPHGRRRDFGLGSAKDVGLAEARKRAEALRAQVKDGREPIAWWKKETAPTPTFREAAKRLHKELGKTWKSGKHGDQWLATLEAHAFPAIGDKPVDLIDAPAVRDVLLEIWLTIPETARRVRQRIGAVLDWAHANGYRPAEAPMRAVSKALPRQPKRDGHFAAMPFADVPAFMKQLRERTSYSRLAVEALILTATRSGEVRGCRWSELDLDKAIWTIPADRMKAGREHVVPLSDSALDVFRRAADIRRGELVFPGLDARKMLSDMTLTKLLREMGQSATVHGFRSSFRDWVAEETSFPAEVAEAALAHSVPDKVVAAYRRTDFFAKRRQLMAAWAGYVEGAPTKVVRLAARRKRNGR